MESLLREILQYNLVAHLKSDDLLWLNFELSEHLELLKVEGAAIEDPAVQAAVWLAQPLVD